MSSHDENKETVAMARNIGNALAEGRIQIAHRVWRLPTVRDEHGNLNPHVRKDD